MVKGISFRPQANRELEQILLAFWNLIALFIERMVNAIYLMVLQHGLIEIIYPKWSGWTCRQ